MKDLVHIWKNSLRNLFAKRSTAVINLLMPFLGILMGLFLSLGGSPKLTLGIVNLDGGNVSKSVVERLASPGTTITTYATAEEGNKALSNTTIRVLVTIPKGWEDDVFAGKTDSEIAIDGYQSDSFSAWLGVEISLLQQNFVELAAASKGDKTVFAGLSDAAAKASPSFQSVMVDDTSSSTVIANFTLGFLAMFLFLGANGGMQNMLNERANRTFGRIRGSPVSMKSYLGGHLLTTLSMLVLQIAFILASLVFIFRVDPQMPYLVLILALLVYSMACITISLFLASASNSTAVFSSLGLIFGPLLTMLSGVFFPPSIMPAPMNIISYLTPQRWLVDAVFAAHAGRYHDYYLSLAVLGLYAVSFLLLASYSIRRRNLTRSYI